MFHDAAKGNRILSRGHRLRAGELQRLLRACLGYLLIFLLLSNALFPDWCRCSMMVGMPMRSMSGKMQAGSSSMIGMDDHCPMAGMGARSCSALCDLAHAPKGTVFGHLVYPAILTVVIAWFALLLQGFIRLPFANLLVVWAHPPPLSRVRLLI
ncbi:hypothetical protein HFU84_05455 [Acidithiobacillus sp. CV18-2]|uniref:hypothetical protein n=1 Tax=Igneacidithiobacillus copahuensis TaxID=2724909 RepID=UPI001C06EEF9|nr:hypothetical protein [Igneacidithiobacillus copahuensis]MBU2753669.1 hypothetical protein [Acidithiobacillus sp. CV18-3]MBU2756451.1 hypothetical protein [Acidithiobacillus sp. BN09-2]MBU2776958.1 hypothetical protein [Acidithiobacillus sp. CV18-2]MBU2796016.1 hypothetical protein [Acidithiobacillus sp. VAN18-2]MBU2799544.1 hypothetical protein [Acidithiobacillus sp. VAN18-4]UTV81350.1 hypothetical protein MQE22_01685 [Acidithiobacillus sp. YTS05]